MDKNRKNWKSENQIESLSPSELGTNWPFSYTFTVDLFELNRYGNCSLLKDFLIDTWLPFEKEDSDYDSDSDEYLENKKFDSWPRLKYKEFFIDKSVVFFEKKELVNEKTKTKVYTLNEISYETLICEGATVYIDLFFKGRYIGGDEKLLKIYSKLYVWNVIFCYLLFTPYSSSIRKVLEKENYPTKYGKEIFTHFLYQFGSIQPNGKLGSLFNIPYLGEKPSIFLNKEVKSLEERFENVFAISNIPTKKGEKLFKDFFVTKSLNETISYYERQNPYLQG